MKMTLKEFKELVGKDKEMNEGFIDSLRKKFGKQEQPKEEFIENYTRFYEDLKDFEKIVEFDRKEKYYLDMIGEQLLSIKEFQNRRDLKPENKNLGVKNGLESIEKIYLPELLQMLANHHPKQFKQKFHSDVLKFYKITVPEVTTKTTRISPRYFPNAIEQMITFAKQKGYSNQYMQKLEQLKNLAEHLKHGYLENPKALTGKEAEVSNFVETIKKILASWRRKYGADYNKMISPELKEFGLNEQSFKKSRYNMSEELKVASDGGYYNAPDRNSYTKEGRAFTDSVIKSVGNRLLNDKEVTVDYRTDVGKLKGQIISILQKRHDIALENEIIEDGVEIYWLSPKQDVEELRDALDYVWQWL